MDFIVGLIAIGCYGFIIAVFFRLWKVLGLLRSVLENFLARHKKLWDALDAIRQQRNRDNQSERE